MKTIFKRSKECLLSALRLLESRRRALSLLIVQVIVGVSTAYADDAGGSDPFAAATGEIAGYQSSVQNLLYAIAAIIALVGAFNVYHKMTNGDQDVKKTIMLTLGGCIAMVALSTALPAFFGH